MKELERIIRNFWKDSKEWWQAEPWQVWRDLSWFKYLHLMLIFLFALCIVVYLMGARLVALGLLNQVDSFLSLTYGLGLLGLGIYLSRHRQALVYLSLLTLTFLYWGSSYLVKISQNINNSDFDPRSYLENGFFQIRGLFSLGLIICLSNIIYYGLRWWEKEDYLDRYLEDYQSPVFLQAMLMTIVIGPDDQLISLVKEGIKQVTPSDSGQIYINLVGQALSLGLCLIILVYLGYYAIKGLRKNRSNLSLAMLTSLLTAFIMNYYLQLAIQGEGQLANRYIFAGATLYQIGFLSLLAFLVYLLCNRYFLGTLVIVFTNVTVAMANFIKMDMRNEPVLVSDLVWLQEIDLILSFVSPSVGITIGLLLLALVGLYWWLRKKILPNPILLKKRYRLFVLSPLFILIFGLYGVFRAESKSKIVEGIPVISRLNNAVDITWLGVPTHARYKSLAFVWTKQLTKRIMEEPENYNQQAIEALSDKYKKLAKVINQERTQKLSDRTVIYILSESLANPNRIPGVTLTRNVLPQIDAIMAGTTSGLMLSDGYGGGTANMEFQTLTGLPFSNYSKNVSVLYAEVAPKMSVFPSISDSFKSENKIVIHPASANNYNRKYIYERLGFGTFVGAGHADEQIIGALDISVYEEVLNRLKANESQFFSVLTMQNHAPWSADEPSDVVARLDGASEDVNKTLTSYARLLSQTDVATKDFLDELSDIDKKITVVFYGDHLPGLYPEGVFSEQPEKQYLTDYFIWSNDQQTKLDYPLVGSSDFPAELLHHTGSKVSPYYALLTEVLNLRQDNSDLLHGTVEEISEDLYLLQYDMSSGKGYIKADSAFFEMEE